MLSRIDIVLRQFRREVLARDTATLAMLSRRWGEVERSLQDEIDVLASDLVEAERAGEAVNHAAWRRMERYQELERQARRVIARYEAWAREVIEGGQRDYFQMGEAFAVEAMDARGPRQGAEAAGLVGNFNRLPVGAVNEMIGMSGDGSPLFDVLKQRALADASIDGLQRALIAGMALGMNPRETARAMQAGLQAGLDKALVIARTEQLRAYRRATIQSYQVNADVVSGYEWVSAMDLRTCAACWSMHGRFFPLDAEMPNDHICGRCTYVPVIRARDERVESGAEQFVRLGEERRKSILGPGRFDLYRRGVPLEQFGRLRTDKVWGRTLELRPVKTVLDKWERAQVDQIKNLTDKRAILRVGELNPTVRSNWKESTTGEIILTGERRRHYLSEHAEMEKYESFLPKVISSFTDVHLNRRDGQMAIFYLKKDDQFYFRAAVWISNDPKKKNSIHSYRISRRSEYETGVKSEKSLIKKPGNPA